MLQKNISIRGVFPSFKNKYYFFLFYFMHFAKIVNFLPKFAFVNYKLLWEHTTEFYHLIPKTAYFCSNPFNNSILFSMCPQQGQKLIMQICTLFMSNCVIFCIFMCRGPDHLQVNLAKKSVWQDQNIFPYVNIYYLQFTIDY